MLTLDEAVAKYKEARDWYEPKQSSRDALDAAVCNVALAVSDLQYNHGQAVAQMHIVRLLGPEKAGG